MVVLTLTDLEVEDVIGADGLAAVFEELLDVHRDGEPLQLGASLGELAHPLRRPGCRGATLVRPQRLSVYCMISLITNRVPCILARRR